MLHKKLDQLLESAGKIPELLTEVKKTLRALRGLRHRVDELEKRIHLLILEGKESRLVGDKSTKPFGYPFPGHPDDFPISPTPPQSPIATLYGCAVAPNKGWTSGNVEITTNPGDIEGSDIEWIDGSPR